MDQNAKAKFILALHKHSLQAFEGGGTVLSGPGQDANTLNATNPNTSGIAGWIGNGLGVNNNFQAGAANIQSGTNTAQLNGAYQGAQSGLAGQQSFAQAAAAQNGFGNQSNVFAQQQALAGQLQQQANGQGPNVAQNALNQATAQNVQNQGALMASQRGASANAGLIARQAAQQGAATQQQSAGQSATLQAQQQIAAQSALANQQAQMQHVAAGQIGAQGQAANNYSTSQQNEQNILQNSNTGYNNAAVSQQGNINNVNAQTAASNQNMAGNVTGNLLHGLSSTFGGLGGFAQGGMVRKYAQGGEAEDVGTVSATASSPSSGPNMPATASNPATTGFAPPSPKSSSGGGGSGSIPGLSSPGGGGAGGPTEMLADNPEALAMAAQGGEIGGPQSHVGKWLAEALGGKIAPKLTEQGGGVAAHGKKEKAVKGGNSYANDKVPALLSEGEIVLPRSVTQHPNAPQKAAEFVMAVMNKKRAGKK